MRLAAIALLGALLGVSVFRSAYGRYTLNRDEPMVQPAPTAVSGPPARRMLFIVLDGARRDAADAVPVLRELRHRGGYAELEADLPTISAAQYVSLITGATPQTSGRRSNDDISVVRLDSVPDVVRRAGGSTAVYSDSVDWWPQLFPGAFDAHECTRRFDRALDLTRGRHDFVLVHLIAFDDAGHAFGATDPVYRVGAALEVQWKISALLARWGDWGPVVVTADHGHRDGGGHGGDEPDVRDTFLIVAGPGVARGASARGRAVDVAPTLSALLGVPAPSGSEGRTLTALLEAAPADLGEPERLAKLGAEAEHTRQGLEAEANVGRALRGATTLVVLLLIAALARRRPRSAALGFAAGLAALAMSCAAYALFIGPVSPSAARLFGLLVRDSAIIGLLAGAVAVAPLFRLREGREHALLAAAAGAGPLVAWMYTAFGLVAPRVSITTAWAIALPTLAWAGWAGVLAVLLVAALAMRPR
jgi:hypothetical protein